MKLFFRYVLLLLLIFILSLGQTASAATSFLALMSGSGTTVEESGTANPEEVASDGPIIFTDGLPASITPESTIITVRGSALGTFDPERDALCFNEVCLSASYVSRYLLEWTDTEFRLMVPYIPNSSTVQITIYKFLSTQEQSGTPLYKTLSLPAMTLQAPEAPQIIDVSPVTELIPGTTIITIRGRGFGSSFVAGAHRICFADSCIPSGLEDQYIRTWSSTEITLLVPEFVRLQDNVALRLRLLDSARGGYSYVDSSQRLRIPPLPNIVRYFATVETGASYYVEGEQFGNTPGSILLNDTILPILSWTDTRIDFLVPNSTRSGVIQVHSANGYRSLPLSVVVQQVHRPTEDPLSHYQWYVDALGVADAWVEYPRAQEVVVAVIDSAVDTGHEDLRSSLWTNPKEIPNNRKDDDGNGYTDDIHGWDFVAMNGRLQPINSHGTQVASLIAATSNNNLGISGLAPNARIMSLDVSLLEQDGSVSVDVDAVQEAILYAVDNGASVINLSFGGVASAPVYRDVLQYAYDHNVLVVAAAGNMSLDLDATFFTPVCEEGTADLVLGVASVSRALRPSSFSNYGASCIDLSAPGEEVIGAIPLSMAGNNVPYSINEGTSFAAPFVTSAAVLLRGTHPDWNVAEIQAALLSSTTPHTGGQRSSFGRGVISFASLLSLSRPQVTYRPSTEKEKPVIVPTNQTIELPNTTPVTPPVAEEEVLRLPSTESNGTPNSSLHGIESFPDVRAHSPYYRAINYLKDRDVLQGYADGSFRPDLAMNRAEFLKVIFEASGSSIQEGFSACFPDVQDEWYAKYVCLAKTLGVVEGYPDGLFRPGQTVNKVEALKILISIHRLGLRKAVVPFADVPADSWYIPYLSTALDMNLLEEEGSSTLYTPNAPVLRKQMAELIYRLTYLQEQELPRFPLE